MTLTVPQGAPPGTEPTIDYEDWLRSFEIVDTVLTKSIRCCADRPETARYRKSPFHAIVRSPSGDSCYPLRNPCWGRIVAGVRLSYSSKSITIHTGPLRAQDRDT